MAEILDYNVIDFIKSLMDNKIRTKANIVTIIDNTDNTYSIEVDNIALFTAGDYVKISDTPNFNDNNVLIKSIQSNSIVIEKPKDIVITTFGSVMNNKPYFICSNWLILSNKLSEKSNVGLYKYQKYPLIYLSESFESEINRETTKEVYSTQTIDVYFFTVIDFSKYANDPDTQRNTINAVLNPIKENFIKTLEQSKEVKEKFVNYKQELLTNFGVKAKFGNDKNILPDWLCAIKVNFEISLQKKYNCN